jgi:spore maturation protein CgeB
VTVDIKNAKIALLGKSNQLHWLENIAAACSRLEWNVRQIRYNQLGLVQDIKRNLFKHIVSKQKSIESNVNAVRKRLQSLKPDIIFVVSPFLLPYEVSRMLDEFDTTVRVAWVGDRIIAEHIPLFGSYDWLFMTDSGFVEVANQFGQMNVGYLPLAANERIFYPRGYPRHDQMLFVASCTEQRIELLKQVADISQLRLIGNRWKKAFSDHNNIDLRDRLIDNEQLAVEYSQANFVLNIRHDSNVINGLNMRSFEAPAAGSCVLQDDVRDVELNFMPGEEIVVYRDMDDLRFQMERLLSDRQYLQSLQQRGHERVMAEHTYMHRLQQIAATLA